MCSIHLHKAPSTIHLWWKCCRYENAVSIYHYNCDEHLLKISIVNIYETGIKKIKKRESRNQTPFKCVHNTKEDMSTKKLFRMGAQPIAAWLSQDFPNKELYNPICAELHTHSHSRQFLYTPSVQFCKPLLRGCTLQAIIST